MRTRKGTMALLALGCLAVAAMATGARADDAASLTLSASPTTVNTWTPATAAGTSLVTITALNADGSAASGVTISLSFAAGGTAGLPAPAGPSLSASSVTTDAAGSATATYTAGAVQGQDTIVGEWGDASASVTIATCVDPSDATTCGADVPIPWDAVPCNPSGPVSCLPEPAQGIVVGVLGTADCALNADDPTTCVG